MSGGSGGRVTRGGRILPHRGNLQLPPPVQVVLQPLPLNQGPPPQRPRLVPTRGRGYRGRGRGNNRDQQAARSPSSSGEEDNSREIQDLKDKLAKTEEYFEEKLKEVRAEAAENVAEENAILQYRLNSNINNHLAQLEEAKSMESFKYNASGAAIQRIVDVRKKLREAVTEGDRDFEDFNETKTGKILSETLDLLDQQEGLIRFAESSKFGFRVLDKIEEEKPKASTLIKNPNLLEKLKEPPSSYFWHLP